jgi:transposase
MQLHWIEPSTGEIRRKKLSRLKFVEFFASLQPVRIVMEACGGAHHWARTFMGLGHDVELLPAKQVRAFVRGNKDDAADAQAIWSAATQGHIRRVPIRTQEQQAIQALHRTRAHWVTIRTATINSMRGLLYEFGVFLPEGRESALKVIGQQRSEIDRKLPTLMIRLLDEQLRTLREIAHDVDVLDKEILALQKSLASAKALGKIPGIGPMGATALAAVLGNGKAWRNGREFAASLGLCPAHTGTGGKVRVGSISKRGDPYLRTLLVSGAHAVAKSPNVSDWVKGLQGRRPPNVVAVAIANKIARTAWALIAHGRNYAKDWRSTAPTKPHSESPALQPTQ